MKLTGTVLITDINNVSQIIIAVDTTARSQEDLQNFLHPGGELTITSIHFVFQNN